MPGPAAYTVSGLSVLGVVRYAEHRGIATGDLVDELGIARERLAAPETRVAQLANDRLWDALAARSGDPAFGLHVAETLDVDALHVVGHLAAHSASYGEALVRFARYSRILHDAGGVEVERDARGVTVYPGCRGLPHAVPRHVAELSTALVVLLARRLTGRPCTALAVELRHARPRRSPSIGGSSA